MSPGAPPPPGEPGAELPLIYDPDVVLDPASDPGAAALGATGAEGTVGGTVTGVTG